MDNKNIRWQKVEMKAVINAILIRQNMFIFKQNVCRKFTHVIINYRYLKKNPILLSSCVKRHHELKKCIYFCSVIEHCLLCQSFFGSGLSFISGSGNHCHSLKRDSACIGADQFCSLMASAEKVFSNGHLSVSKLLLPIG